MVSIETRLGNMNAMRTTNILPEEDGGNLQLALPLTEIESIRAFEERIQSDNNYKQPVGLIRGLGGSCLANAIKRAWLLVFSLQVRSGCNWGGKIRNGVKKLGIAKSPVTRAVFEGIKGVPQFTHIAHFCRLMSEIWPNIR
ncbi:hypothetical protein OUZ56_008983 [Daphnia magna]|uniref:DUF4806 domain-containing protein n=1 Tax=Daphnia magna TaxID=35525 RepID=A0ABR0AEN5_9CRUS|nr:hypothetical protein OUZ56_008983 [Daphnia magna]